MYMYLHTMIAGGEGWNSYTINTYCLKQANTCIHAHVQKYVHVQCMPKNTLFMLIHSVEFDTPLPVGGICMSHQEQRDSDSILHDHCAGERKEET